MYSVASRREHFISSEIILIMYSLVIVMDPQNVSEKFLSVRPWRHLQAALHAAFRRGGSYFFCRLL
jgi:hypothetical protein